MGMELKKGRLFAPTDRPGTAPVVVINDVTARRYWPNSNPLGTRMQEASVMQGEKPVYVTVIGIVRQSRNFGAGEEAVATVYLSESQMSGNLWATIVARSIGDPRSVVGVLRETAEAIVPGETKVSAIRTGEEIVAQYTAPLKFETTQLDTFAAIALLLAAIGVYGLISYFTSQRTHEIGLRLALGAQRHELLRMVIGQAMGLVLAGVAIGLCGALALRRAVRSLLFDVSSTDPATFAGVVVLLVVVALLACWIPARRATRVDPMVALRYE
jgi:putative ABC transport system permease protein